MNKPERELFDQLWQFDPVHFVTFRIVEEWLVEDPELIAEIHRSKLDLLFALPQSAQWFLGRAIAYNPELKAQIASNRLTCEMVLVELWKLSLDDVWLGCAIAANPNTPSWVLDRLSTRNHDSILFEVAYNLNTPVSTLRKIMALKRGTVIAVIAKLNLDERKKELQSKPAFYTAYSA